MAPDWIEQRRAGGTQVDNKPRLRVPPILLVSRHISEQAQWVLRRRALAIKLTWEDRVGVASRQGLDHYMAPTLSQNLKKLDLVLGPTSIFDSLVPLLNTFAGLQLVSITIHLRLGHWGDATNENTCSFRAIWIPPRSSEHSNDAGSGNAPGHRNELQIITHSNLDHRWSTEPHPNDPDQSSLCGCCNEDSDVIRPMLRRLQLRDIQDLRLYGRWPLCIVQELKVMLK